MRTGFLSRYAWTWVLVLLPPWTRVARTLELRSGFGSNDRRLNDGRIGACNSVLWCPC